MRRSSTGWIAAAAVVLATVAADAPVLRNGFTSYDDGVYVLENPHVRMGLSAEGLLWTFSATHAGNWHPLTWISHMLDWQLWGAAPTGHHASGLVLHAADALLLFVVLRRLTGSFVRSAIVAALFGAHPLQVETVAWAAERKSLLCTLFWWLSILAYGRWASIPSRRRFAAVVLCASLALMSKPMAVTLPFTLLLLDAWPLGRLSGADPAALFRAAWRLTCEKWLLFALSAAASVITIAAQRSANAISSLQRVPWTARLANAPVSYAKYLFRAFWPRELAVYYPHSGNGIPPGTVATATLVLAALSSLAWRERSRRPYVAVGWLWFLGTLVPVIGIVQVGGQAMADRYAYVPLVGVFVALVWGVGDLAETMSRRLRAPAVALACVWIGALAVQSREQARVWHDTRTLFEHALAVTGDNAIAHVNLGLDDARNGRLDEARRHYEAALRSNPYDADIHNNLGNILAKQGKLAEAVPSFLTALRLRPDYGLAHANLAAAYLFADRYADAWQQVELARKSGFEPPADLVRELSSAMPKPEGARTRP